MEAITIHPGSTQQLERVKVFLKELGIPFENQSHSLSEKLVESINRGVAQSDRGEYIGLKEFKKKFSLK